MKPAAKLLVIGAALCALAVPAAAQPFSQVIVFGDSNADSGYYKALPNPGGNATYNSLWPTGVAHGAGAPTTNPGQMYPQFLGGFFGLTANPANTAGGTNYATSGAKNKTVNNAQTGGFTAAIPTVTQIANYLSANGGSADSQALYVVHSGDNDISYALGETGQGPFPPDPNAYMDQAAADLTNAIASLHNAGAQHIIVNGLHYDFPLNNATKRALRLRYTNALWNGLTTLGIPFIRSDIDKVQTAIFANPAKYGFTSVNTTTVGCTQPNGITTAWALLCSSDPQAPSTWVSATAPFARLFADDEHYGTAGQKLEANYLRRLLIPPSATHDFLGFGKSGIAWRQNTGAAAIWLMNGAQVAQSGGLGTIATSWRIVGQRDFNGDGRADLLWRDNSGAVAVWLMSGLSVLQNAGLGTVPNNWVIAGTGDFNADGNGDLLWYDQASGTVVIWLLNGAQVTQSGSLGAVASNWVIAGTGDFNVDGNWDILWYDTNTGTVAIWLLDGLKVSQSASLGAGGSNWSIVGTGDFNGDGNWDILWRNSTTGTVAIWLLNGLSVMQSGTLGSVPSQWAIQETGDFNGDGKSDILWRNTTTGDVAIWFMNGLQVSSATTVANVATSWTIQGENAD